MHHKTQASPSGAHSPVGEFHTYLDGVRTPLSPALFLPLQLLLLGLFKESSLCPLKVILRALILSIYPDKLILSRLNSLMRRLCTFLAATFSCGGGVLPTHSSSGNDTVTHSTKPLRQKLGPPLPTLSQVNNHRVILILYSWHLKKPAYFFHPHCHCLDKQPSSPT